MVGFREIDIKIKVVTNKVILTRNCFEPFPNWLDTKGFVHIPTAVCILWVDKSTCEVDHSCAYINYMRTAGGWT